MAAAAAIEHNGTPIDAETLEGLRSNWTRIQTQLVREVNQDFDVYIPAGSKLDETTASGAAIVETAQAYSIDPYQLADAVDYLWHERRDALEEHSGAVEAARRDTGLTINRIAKWEDAGRDSSEWPGLDTKVRELAGTYPAPGHRPRLLRRDGVRRHRLPGPPLGTTAAGANT